MSNSYTPTTNFGAKDSLSASDPNKVVRGSEFSTEFSAIENAFAASAPKASPTFTGTATFETVDVADLTSSGTATLSGVVPSSDVLPVTGSVSVSDHMSIGNTETPAGITATALDDLIVGSLGSDGGVIVLSSPTGTGAYSFIDAATGSVAGRIIYQHSTDEMTFQSGGFGRGRFTGTGSFAVCTTADAPDADDKLYVGTTSGIESFTVSGIENTANCYARLDSPQNRRNALVWEAEGVAQFTMERGDSDDGDSTKLYIHPSGPDGGTSSDFVMDASGSVGIGTSSPAEKLDVVGNAKASGAHYSRSGTFSVGPSGTTTEVIDNVESGCYLLSVTLSGSSMEIFVTAIVHTRTNLVSSVTTLMANDFNAGSIEIQPEDNAPPWTFDSSRDNSFQFVCTGDGAATRTAKWQLLKLSL